jgi:hypothetical protein
VGAASVANCIADEFAHEQLRGFDGLAVDLPMAATGTDLVPRALRSGGVEGEFTQGMEHETPP